MEISQIGLFSLLLHSAVCGVLLGVFCDAWRLMRIAVRIAFDRNASNVSRPFCGEKITAFLAESPKATAAARALCSAVTFVADLICVIAASIVLIIVAYACNSGRMRWMTALGLLMGFALYSATVGKLVTRVSFVIMLALKKLILKKCRAIRRSLKCLKIKTKSNIVERKRKKGGARCEKER